MGYNLNQKMITDIEVDVTNSFDLESQTNYNSWSVVFGCSGISCKLIRTPMEYTGFLVRYAQDSETGLHYNDCEYELLKVKDGEIVNLETNERYKTGDTLFIDKNKRHNIKAVTESYVFCLMTKHKSVLEKLKN